MSACWFIKVSEEIREENNINIYEEENISKVIIKMGLPAMLGQLTTLVYNLADTYFVSLTRDSAQIAAVTLCMPILLIIMSISSIFGMGGGSVIARKIGENRNKDACNCFSFSTYAIAASSVAVAAVGLVFIKQTAVIIGADDSNIEYTCDYLRWILIGAPAIMLGNGLVHSFRSVGLIRVATLGVAIGNVINMVFDWVLIVPMKMGAKGAAMATSLGFLITAIYYLTCMVKEEKKSSELIHISPRGFRLKRSIALNTVRIGIPGAMITVMMSLSNIVLNNYIGLYGSDAVAAYGIAYKIDSFSVMLSVGLSQGVGPLMGYYYGKGDERRLSSSVRVSTVYGVILGAVFTVLIFFSSHMLAGIFLKEAALSALAALFMRLMCFHAPMLGVINMVTAYFQALGRAANSLLITVLRNLVLFIPGTIILNHFAGLNGVVFTQVAVESILMIICSAMYMANKPAKLIPLQSNVDKR